MGKRLYRVRFTGHTYIVEADNANQIKAWVHDQISLGIGNPNAQQMRDYLEGGQDVVTLPTQDRCPPIVGKAVGG